MTMELTRLLLFRFIAVFAVYVLIQKARVLFDWWRHGKSWHSALGGSAKEG
jgi:hypothetical protein